MHSTTVVSDRFSGMSTDFTSHQPPRPSRAAAWPSICTRSPGRTAYRVPDTRRSFIVVPSPLVSSSGMPARDLEPVPQPSHWNTHRDCPQ